MPIRLTSQETLILKGIYEHKSLQEISKDVGVSAAYVHRLLTTSSLSTLVTQPRSHAARSRVLSKEAEEYLAANGHIPGRIFGG
jgi:AraC-like DNA-binding protein